MVWAVGLLPGSFPDVADPTDADAGRTDVSVGGTSTSVLGHFGPQSLRSFFEDQIDRGPK